MTLKHLYILFLAAFIACVAASQNPDELHIPVENDNQFPPDNHFESDGNILEDRDAGTTEELVDVTTLPTTTVTEDAQSTLLPDTAQPEPVNDIVCPEPCVCNTEGDTGNFIVDCSGYDLTEFPKPLDPKTTILNMQNNKLTEIPEEVSSLKNLKVLNANNNFITDLASGSISELLELTTLKLGNNRLTEFPEDLKNSFGLTKLEELDLGGNDMRTALTSDTFLKFKALRKLTVPTSTSLLLDDLCESLKESLETICTGTCSSQSFDCPKTPPGTDDGFLVAVLPGTIAITSSLDDADSAIEFENKQDKTDNNKEESVKPPEILVSETTASSVYNTEEDPVNKFTTVVSETTVSSVSNNEEDSAKESANELSDTTTSSVSNFEAEPVKQLVIAVSETIPQLVSNNEDPANKPVTEVNETTTSSVSNAQEESAKEPAFTVTETTVSLVTNNNEELINQIATTLSETAESSVSNNEEESVKHSATTVSETPALSESNNEKEFVQQAATAVDDTTVLPVSNKEEKSVKQTATTISDTLASSVPNNEENVKQSATITNETPALPVLNKEKESVKQPVTITNETPALPESNKEEESVKPPAIITNETPALPVSNKEEESVIQPGTAVSEAPAPLVSKENVSPTEEVSSRSAVNKIPEGVAQLNSVIDIPTEVVSNTDADVTVGATTSDTKTGGVNKSVIGMVVAGMVLIVAGITIKKNWSSIKNKFSSTPRSPNNHHATNANGTSPEEVPLQQKLPV